MEKEERKNKAKINRGEMTEIAYYCYFRKFSEYSATSIFLLKRERKFFFSFSSLVLFLDFFSSRLLD